MSAPRPNPADEPEIPPTSGSELADEPAGEAGEAGEELTDPPTAELPADTLPAQEPADEATTAEEPADEATTAEQPTDAATTAEEPADEATTAEQPAGEATTAEEPADEVTTAEEPAGAATTAEEPAGAATTAEEPADAVTTAEEPAGEPAAQEPADAPAVEDATETPATAEVLVSLIVVEESADAPLEDEAEEPAGVPASAAETSAAGELLADAGPGAQPVEQPVWLQVARRPTFGQAIVMVTGVLLFVWGFLPWYSDSGGSANAWSTVTIPGLLLTATWVPLLSLAIAIFVAIKAFANGFPDRIAGFSWAQLSIMVGLFDTLISLGFLVANRRLGDLGSLDLGAGLILSFITSLALLAGATFDHLEMGRAEISARLRAPANSRNRQ